MLHCPFFLLSSSVLLSWYADMLIPDGEGFER